MILVGRFVPHRLKCILHVCGGDPQASIRMLYMELYSPRMWRWSLERQCYERFTRVFSTYVEVILCDLSALLVKSLYSPRMWRWSRIERQGWLHSYVFSTYVEVILKLLGLVRYKICILHVCGGDPLIVAFLSWLHKYSPRMWRWSQGEHILLVLNTVFSTYVEVILTNI